jgi:hypothetical protein
VQAGKQAVLCFKNIHKAVLRKGERKNKNKRILGKGRYSCAIVALRGHYAVMNTTALSRCNAGCIKFWPAGVSISSEKIIYVSHSLKTLF